MDGHRIRQKTKLRRAVLCAIAFSPLLSGCAGFIGHLGYWSGASLNPAEYSDLAERRVAVVCVSDASSYGAGAVDNMLARMTSDLLREHVDDIELVPASEVADWVDKNDWDSVDYLEVGKGVKADRVVAIDMSGFRLHQDQVLYKARAGITVTVFDMLDGGKEVFRRTLPEITFPENGYYSTSDTSEATFRQVFLKVLARRAARYFFSYDQLNEPRLDPAVAG